jgi:molybdenum cofactor biosynthesis enzyme MoaA
MFDFGERTRSNSYSEQIRNPMMLARLLPSVRDVSVTNLGDAACDYSGITEDKTLVGPRRYLGADVSAQALRIFYRRRIHDIALQGEPSARPDIVQPVAEVAAAGMQSAIINHGWFRPRVGEASRAAGVNRLTNSIDSADLALRGPN